MTSCVSRPKNLSFVSYYTIDSVIVGTFFCRPRAKTSLHTKQHRIMAFAVAAAALVMMRLGMAQSVSGGGGGGGREVVKFGEFDA